MFVMIHKASASCLLPSRAHMLLLYGVTVVSVISAMESQPTVLIVVCTMSQLQFLVALSVAMGSEREMRSATVEQLRYLCVVVARVQTKGQFQGRTEMMFPPPPPPPQYQHVMAEYNVEKLELTMHYFG